MKTHIDEECAVVLNTSNVNSVFLKGLKAIYEAGDQLETRNGLARVLPYPLITHYENPQQRVLFMAERDANPFFHLFEALWMLAGRNDVAFIQQFAANMSSYSDDGDTFNGAYGYRWRRQFGCDQLEHIVDILTKDPGSRRVVLQMWDTDADLLGGIRGSKDVCCNLLVKYRIRNNRLNAYVMNRSNDMLFGGYGANAFHFSFLQEYLADRLNVDIGVYEQISLDAHLYTAGVYGEKLWSKMENAINSYDYKTAVSDPYQFMNVFTVSPLLLKVTSTMGDDRIYSRGVKENIPRSPDKTLVYEFDSDLRKLTRLGYESLGNNEYSQEFKHPYFQWVVAPLLYAHKLHKEKKTIDALAVVEAMGKDVANHLGVAGWTFDLALACSEWLTRRIKT